MQSKLLQICSYLLHNKMHLLKIAFVCLFFYITSYFFIQTKLAELKNQTQNNFSIIENYIDSEISNANHIIYSLTATLLHDFQLKDNNRIQEIIDIFDPQLKHPQFPPFSGYKVLGANNEFIAITIKYTQPFLKNKVETDPKYLAYIENIKREPFKLYVAPIRLSRERPDVEIIPMGMALVNNEKQYIGAVVTGLLTDKLTERLNKLLPFLKNIKLYNVGDKEKVDNSIVGSNFTFVHLMSHVIENKPIIILHSLANYPFLVEAKINPEDLNQVLTKTVFFCVVYFLLFSIFAYFLWIANRKSYSQSLKKIKNKLDASPDIKHKINEIFNIDYNKKLTPEELSNIISNIIDSYCDLYLNYENSKVQQPINEIENKVLQLILTERHYYQTHRNCHTHHASELYLNQLKSFINEGNKTYHLADFLKEVISYCAEYYHELNVVLEPVENDRTFSFKHAALCETIFNIFTLILRIGQFGIDTEQVIVRGLYYDLNSKFPTITIEATIIDSTDVQALGWNSGVSYIYSSLFTIYMLAKENNLFFHIEQIEKRIFFILEPVAEERLAAAENCVLKYIKNKS